MVEETKIPEGYKKIDVGVIPENWDYIKIGDIFDFKNGLNKEKQYFGEGTPIVNYMDVYLNRGLKSSDIKGKVTVTSNELNAYEVKKGDVFFTRTSETPEEIGITSVVLDDIQLSVFSGFILRARPKKDAITNEYKKYCFSVEEVRKEIKSKCTYTTRALTNGKVLSQIGILVPPLPEQQAIATALTDVDNLITSLEKLINKKEKIKQGTMQQLLTGKKRLPGFSGEWEVRRFDKLFLKLSSNKYQIKVNEYSNSGQFPVIDQGKNKIIGYSDAYNKALECPKDGLIVFGDHTRVFKYVDFNFVVGADGTQLLCTKDNNNPKFFYYQFLNKQIPNMGYNRHFKFIKEMKFLVPALEEQQAIAQILSDMDSEIEVLNQKLEKYKTIKQGMMQELLTGRIRLV